MGYPVRVGQTPEEFALELARGNIQGMARVRKFGHNDGLSNLAFEEVWDGSTAYTYLTAAVAVRVKAGGDAADDQDGGAGARSITIQGLDENWNVQEETVNTEGADVGSPTTVTFVRIFRAFVATVGTYGVANTAAVTIETTTGTTQAIIAAGKGQTQMALYTVPLGKVAYLTGLIIDVGSTNNADFRMFRREDADDSTAPMSSLRLVSEFDNINQTVQRNFLQCGALPAMFPAKTDIICVGQASNGSAEVSVEFDLVILDA